MRGKLPKLGTCTDEAETTTLVIAECHQISYEISCQEANMPDGVKLRARESVKR